MPLANVISKLLEMEGGQGPPTAMLGNKHLLCWGFEDQLSGIEKDAVNPPAGVAAPGSGGQAANAGQAQGAQAGMFYQYVQ